ncbi:MAG: ABC transporter permease [Pseudomonadota bacterium]
MNGASRLAMLVILAWAVVAIWGSVVPMSPNEIDLTRILERPGRTLFGYDDLGRAIVSRLVIGASTSLGIALLVVGISALIGVSVGMLAAWYGGAVDLIAVRIIDVFLAFPGVLLAIALAGALGPGIGSAVFALAATGWVGFARLARAQTLVVRQHDHVQVAIALGTPGTTILRRHVLPLIAAPLLVETTFALAAVIVAEASLSFLGLGVQTPDASWGNMIRDGAAYLLVAPHMVMVPGLAITSLVIAFNVLGDCLQQDLRGSTFCSSMPEPAPRASQQ